MRRRLANLLALSALCAGCDSTYRLPPIGPQPPASSDQSGNNDDDDDDNTDTTQNEPALAVAAYLQNKLITVERDGVQVACFTNLGTPCQGKITLANDTIRNLAAGDQCLLTNPPGEVHLVVKNSAGKVEFDIRMPVPAQWMPIPSEIGDENARAILNGQCQL